MKCMYCGSTVAELRPYGPGGGWLCYDCMMADPKREETAKEMFAAQIEAAGSVVVIGEQTGPRPIAGGTQ